MSDQKCEIIGIAITPKIMAEMEARDHVTVTVETGIDGDARGKKRGRQISILFEDDWNDAVAETGPCHGLDGTTRQSLCPRYAQPPRRRRRFHHWRCDVGSRHGNRPL